MALFSAYEDFCARTLSALRGTWEKLEFVSGLKRDNNQYEHWGLKYTFGPVQANRAMAQAHTDLFQETLETPLPALAMQVEEMGKKDGPQVTPDQYVPEERNGCSKEHFRYVSTALSLLAESRSSHPTA